MKKKFPHSNINFPTKTSMHSGWAVLTADERVAIMIVNGSLYPCVFLVGMVVVLVVVVGL